MMCHQQAIEKSYELFSTARLGHASRTKRLVRIGAALLPDPAASLPKAIGDRHQAKLAYDFLANQEVTPEGILSAMYTKTLERSKAYSVLLLISDTTEFDYTTHKQAKGFGHIGDGKGVGFLMHSTLVCSAEGEVLGEIDQKTWTRKVHRNARKETSHKRKKRERESAKWRESFQSSAERYQDYFTENRPKLVGVADSEVDDFYSFIACEQALDSYVLRVVQNRRVQIQIEEEGEEKEITTYLREAAARAPVRGHKEIEVKARPDRKAREALLEIRATPLQIQVPQDIPQRIRQSEGLVPLRTNLVFVSEVNPPPGEERIEWYLLTRESIETEEDVLRIVGIYEKRWKIEEFHMVLKTGCRMEERQLEHVTALENLLAIMTPIAIEIMRIRDVARAPEERPIKEVLSEAQIKVLKHLVEMKGHKKKITEQTTAREALRSIAVLGGFMGTSKTEPGWRTLWAGFQLLLTVELGYRIVETGER
jgi:hypothetical protein